MEVVDLIDLEKVAALTPENLLAVFRALLLCEQSVNHLNDGFSIDGRKLVNPLGDNSGVGYILKGDFGRGQTSEEANICFSSAA